MPEFLPFTGTRYNQAKVNLANVVSPPYDMISPEYRDILYARDPHNVIRLELNRDADPYTSAATYLNEWKCEGVLRRDERAAFYVYHQIFDTPSSKQVTRTGVIGRVKLTPYEAKQVLPHERTLPAPKLDRLRLMEHTKANLSPIIALVSDASFVFDRSLEVATVQPPLADVDEYLQDGEVVRHLLWRMEDTAAVERIEHIVGSNPIIIADGHHRYETALRYHELHPEIPGADHMMMFISNLESEGTVVFPTHRILHDAPNFNQYRLLEKLRERYELVPFTTREEGMAMLDRDDAALTLIEFNEDPRWVLARDLASESHRPVSGELPADRLESEILKQMIGLTQDDIDRRKNLLYPHSLKELDEIKESRSTDAAFLLRAVKPHEIASVVRQGHFMPQKTTFFYPKLVTGLVFNEFD